MADEHPRRLRDRLAGSGRHHADALVSPLPPGIPAELARSRALKTHGNVAKAWKASQAELVRLQALAEATEREDADAARAAARAGRPLPPAKVADVREALATAERDLAIVGDELVRATDDLLDAAAAVAAEQETTADDVAAAAEDAARVALQSAIDALDRSADAEARAQWWFELANDGRVAPFRPGTISRERQMYVQRAINFLDERRERVQTHIDEQRRLAEADAKLPLPPTTALAPEPVTADGAAS